MPGANLFSQCFVSALYTCELIAGKSIGGAAHTLASRDVLHRALDALEPSEAVSLRRAFLLSASISRCATVPLFLLFDAATGTGKTHRAPTGGAAPAKGIGVVSEHFANLKIDWRNARTYSHEERVTWLFKCAAQLLDHPCDVGLMGVVVGGCSVAMLFFTSAISVAVSALVGCAAYAAQKCVGVKAVTFSNTCRDANAWVANIAAILLPSFLPNMTVSLVVATAIGQLAFDIGNPVPMYLWLQVFRLATATLKMSVSAVGGVALCPLIYAGLLTQQAISQYCEAKAKAKDAKKSFLVASKDATQAAASALRQKQKCNLVGVHGPFLRLT